MTSTRMAWSHMTLALAEATGWYKPNYAIAEKLYWGKNKGCTFLKNKCVSGDPLRAVSPEFCSQRSQGGCDFESMTPALCSMKKGAVPNPTHWNYYGNNLTASDSFTDGCAVDTRIGS